MAAGIYTITSPSNKIYVGQTVDLKMRVRFYERNNCFSQRKLHYSLLKYSWGAHAFEVVMPLRDGLSQEIKTFYEQFFMDYYRSLGYELLNVREAGSTGKTSPETKKRQSLSLSKEKHPWWGKRHSEETKAKIALSVSKLPKDPLVIEKVRLTCKSKPKVFLTNRKLSDVQIGQIRQLLSENRVLQKDIAKAFNISRSVICNIKKGLTWSHLK